MARGWRRSVAVLATCLAVASCSSDGEEGVGTKPSGATPSSARAADLASVPPCPLWSAEPDYPDGQLPSGAVTLRVCAGDDPVSREPQWIQGIAPPDDPLVTGVEDLVDQVNSRPGWTGEPDQYCSAEGRPRIKYVFGYLDGSTSTMTDGYGSCHLLELEAPGDFPTSDSLVKVGAIEFRDTVAKALLTQRRTQQEPLEVAAAPGCVPNVVPKSILPVQQLDLASAALCLLPDGRHFRRVHLDQSLMSRIEDTLHGGSRTTVQGCDELKFAKLVGTSTWGDPVMLDISNCAIELGDDNSKNEPNYLPLDPDLVAALLSLPRGRWQRQR